MKIAIISDLHIKEKDGASDFHFTDKQFYKEIKDICKIVDILVINGDFIELWQSSWPTEDSRRAEFKKALDRYPITLRYIFRNPKIQLIQGNHDEELSFFGQGIIQKKIIKKLTIENRSESFHTSIYHGIFDFFNTKAIGFSKFIAWLAGWLERILHPMIEVKLDGFVRKIFGINLFKNQSQIKGAKVLIATDSKLKCIINSHTHSPQIVKFSYRGQERIFINTGRYDGRNHKNIIFFDTNTFEVLQKSTDVPKLNFSKFTKQLKSGDVILSYNKTSLISSLIKNITEGSYSHSMVYMGSGKIIEAITGGVQVSQLDKYLEGNHDLLILRLYDRSKIGEFIKSLYKELGSGYSYSQLFVDLFYFLIKKWFGKDIRKNIDIDSNYEAENCSELVTKALNQAYGLSLPYATSTPQDLVENTKIFYRVYSQFV